MTITNQTSFGLVGVSIYDTSLEQKYALGTRIRVNYGPNKDKSAEVVYCKNVNALTLTAGRVLELPLISGTDAFLVDTTISVSSADTLTGAIGQTIACCVPAVNIPTLEFGWFFVNGIIPVNLAANCAALKPLYPTASPGGIPDDAITSCIFNGLWAISTIGGSSAIGDCFVARDLTLTKLT